MQILKIQLNYKTFKNIKENEKLQFKRNNKRSRFL